MKILKYICILLIMILFSGCTQVGQGYEESNQTNAADSADTEECLPDETDNSTNTHATEEFVPQYGKVYSGSEFEKFVELVASAAAEKRQQFDQLFAADLETGKIPQTMTVDYMDKNYEFELRSKTYSHDKNLTYGNSEIGVTVRIDADSLGQNYYYLLAYNNKLEKCNKVSKEEKIQIAEKYLEKHFESDKNKIVETIIERTVIPEEPMIVVRYSYSLEELLYRAYGEVIVNAYGQICEAKRSMRDAVLIGNIELLNPNEYKSIIESMYRQANCNCELSLKVSYSCECLNGENYAFATLTLDTPLAKTEGENAHWHFYYEHSGYVFVHFKN